MKASEINAILRSDPNAEFALMPGLGMTVFVKVRGLTSGIPGTWKFKSVCRDGKWSDVGGELTSRDLATHAQASAECERMIRESDESLARYSTVVEAVSRLASLGIQAKATARGLEIRDMVALGELLERIG